MAVRWASRSAAASAHSEPPALSIPAMVAEVAAVTSVAWLAPAPAKPSRMPAVAMIPSLATTLQARSELGSVAAARTRASQLWRPPPVIAVSSAGGAATSRSRRADERRACLSQGDINPPGLRHSPLLCPPMGCDAVLGPSLLAVFLDAGLANGAGNMFFNAVHARWSDLPLDRRPKLVLFGKSLGTAGVEAPFVGGDA